MHKIVNGVKVELSAAEESAVLREWDSAVKVEVEPSPTLADVIAVLTQDQRDALKARVALKK